MFLYALENFSLVERLKATEDLKFTANGGYDENTIS